MATTVDIDTIEQYLSFKRALIPIHLRHGKRPLHSDWTNKRYTKRQLIKYAEKGYNLGFRLGQRDLVIDVDPRNGGKKGIKKLELDCGAKLRKSYPTVKTGSGGWHIYIRFRKDQITNPSIPGRRYKFKEQLNRYPGVEFKTFGRQVIIPGSIHPDTKKRYKWDEDSPWKERPHIITKSLLAIIAVRPKIKQANEQRLTPDELAQILKQIPISEYDSNATWFPILAASHYATGGTGYKAFLDWSLSDPRYIDDERAIESRWNSLDPAITDGFGTGTLLLELYKHGGESPDSLTAIEEFENDFDEDPDHIENKVPGDSDDIFDFDTKPKETKQNLSEYIDTLTATSTHKRIFKALRQIVKLDYLKQYMYLRDIHNVTGIPILELKRSIAMMRGQRGQQIETEDDPQQIEDLAQQIVSELLDTEYEGGKTIIHSRDQNYWTYTGTHWVEKPQNMIEQAIYKACVRYRANNPTIDFTTSAAMAQCERVLRARVATMDDLFRLEQEPKSIINVANGELWIDGENGKWKLKKHKPKSYLLSCLESVEYDPDANCPLFDQTLLDIFALQKDCKDVIRHLWELFGYAMQPRKNIPSWWLFYGRGANGKTLILRILSALLGNSVLEHTIGNFDTSRNTHAFADLPGKLVLIDEDIRSNTTLPDDFLKKVSENKILLANPKFKIPFRFRCTVTPILAANTVPITRDLSEGMLRRANVIPFRRQFLRKEMDLDRDRKIIENELPGVLNRALKGLARLRKRGQFRMPKSCRSARRSWLYESTPLLSFISDCCIRGKANHVEIRRLWDEYDDWCESLEIEPRYRYSVRGLVKALLENGFERGRLSGGNRSIKGLKLAKESIEDDIFDF